MAPTFLRRYGRVIGLIALLCALTLAMAGFGGSAQAPLPPASPVSVGQVTNLQARAEAQAPGMVRLSWNAAENAQVYFVVYLKSSEAVAGNYDSVRTKAFTGTEGEISGLVAGTPYHFIAMGMRWNWPSYGATWGSWSAWSSATPSAGSAATDRAALIAFYNATNGPNWTNNRNWLSAMPLNQWHGVTTDVNGRVVSLDFLGNHLSGKIPAEMGNLTHLRTMSLHNNQISGEIPIELGNLTNSTILDLSANLMSGPIPPELSNLTSIKILSLHTNQLSGSIPSELGNLTTLTGLYLGYNQLSGQIPPELGNLPNLTGLNLDYNQLSGSIPTELGSLINLTNLALGGNQLSGLIPPELGSLVNLESITLYGNRLTGCIPTALRNVRHNDLAKLGLPFCGQASLMPTPNVWPHRPVFDDGIDIGVTHIERLPRFERYKVTYLGDQACPYPFDESKGPVVCPEQDGIKRWPSAGETIELTAHVWNFGDTGSGPFGYAWKMNDTLLRVSRHSGLESGEHAKFTLSTEWPADGDNPTVAFAVDTQDEIDELIEDNNVVVDWIKGYTIGFYFSPESYESLTLSNIPGQRIQSPEHWVHNNVAHLNDMLANAGLDDRVRAELFFITDDINLDDHTDLQWFMDGMWRIWHQDPWDTHATSIFSLEGYQERPEIDFGLLHELLHQLGAIDLYRMFIDTRNILLPDANRQGQKAGCGTDYWHSSYVCFRLPDGINDIMGSRHLVMGTHTAGGLKSNAGHRRGHYGEYLYDTPSTVSVRIVDQDGRDLPNVALRFYQYEHQGQDHLVDAIPEFELTTNGNGIAVLPNRGITGIVTATGHQLRPNPFGVIDVVGTNGTFVIEMQGPCINYEWLTIVELNLAYWDGQKDHATFTKTLRCPPP